MSAPSELELFDWWLGELDDDAAARVEAALFEDDSVLAQLQWLRALAEALATAVPQGALPMLALTHGLAVQLERAGLPHTAYVVAPGQTVACAATVDQRYSVARLQADLQGVERVDVRVRSPHLGELRFDDVPFDHVRSEVVLLQSGDAVRSVPTTTLTFELRGVRSGAEVELGTFVMAHRALGDAG